MQDASKTLGCLAMVEAKLAAQASADGYDINFVLVHVGLLGGLSSLASCLL